MRKTDHFILAAAVWPMLLVSACATKPPTSAPTHFYASWNGIDPNTGLLFEAVDSQMRIQPGFLRNFDDTMHIHIGDGVSASDGNMRFDVRITIDPRMQNRRISKADQTLSEFSVVCVPDAPQSCVDRIIERARVQPSRIRRIIARSPQT